MTGKFVPLIPKRANDVTITIQADAAALTSANLDALEKTVFTQTPKVDDLPEYWRDFMAHGEQDRARQNGPNAGVAPVVQLNSKPVSLVGHHVSPPRSLETAEPEFSEMARRAGYQGTVVLRAVVDKRGQLSQIKIKRALGWDSTTRRYFVFFVLKNGALLRQNAMANPSR